MTVTTEKTPSKPSKSDARKGLEFNPTLAILFIVTVVIVGLAGYAMLNVGGSDRFKPTPRSTYAMVQFEPSSTPFPTSTPSPTPDLTVAFLRDCDVLQYPLVDSPAVGMFRQGSAVFPIGVWFDYVQLSMGWVRTDCFPGLSPYIPFVSPGLLPLPTPTITPFPTSTPILPTATVYVPPALATSTPLPPPSPTPILAFRPLPDGVQPGGWCVKVAAKSVTLADGSIYPARDGYVHLSEGVIGMTVIIERNGWYYDYAFMGCGLYQ